MLRSRRPVGAGLLAPPANRTTAATIIALLSLGYLLPACIAYARGHRHATAIGVINLLLGWTLIGWVAPLAWAFAAPSAAEDARQACPHCAEPILLAARVCHFCGHDLPAGWSNHVVTDFLRRASSTR